MHPKLQVFRIVSGLAWISMFLSTAGGADVLPPLRIAIIGDSTVSTYRPDADGQVSIAGWGQVLSESFVAQVTISNHAASGRSSKSFLSEGRWEPVLKERPDYVLIQFGHNDCPGKGDRTTDPDGDFRDNLRRYIRDARQQQTRPILVTPVARRTFQDGRITSSLTPYVRAMLAVGQEEQVPVIDLNASSTALFERLGDAASADLNCGREGDRTHFSLKGARVMAGLVAKEIPTAAPDLAAYLKSSDP